MIRKTYILIFLVVLLFPALAQVNSSTLSKSIVKVQTVIGTRANVSTGFIWKSPNQVVTSLHAMSPSATEIRILYLNNAWRTAKVKKVLQKADLVLLELLPGQTAPAGAVPLSSFNSLPIEENNELKALGYNSNAPGISSRLLKKGFVDPETLKALVPPKDLEVLRKVGFPEVDLPIIYLDGSLLPGYSGAPVFDMQGKLVGIGDGGLEKGASNVSWIIPAKFLPELEISALNGLPSSLPEVSQLFSAITTIEAEEIPELLALNEEPQNEGSHVQLFSSDVSLEEINEDLAQEEMSVGDSINPDSGDYSKYQPLVSEDFEFYLTKSRSLVELYESSEDPENLVKFVTTMDGFNVKLDYQNLRFDIYEDINHGVVLAVPSDEEFFYDAEGEHFEVNYAANPNVDLIYMGMADDYSDVTLEDELDEVFEWLPEMMAEFWNVDDFEIDTNYTYLLPYDEDRKIAYVLLESESFMDPELGGNCKVILYVTLLLSKEKSFMSVASYKMATEKLRFAENNGLDCINSDHAGDCKYFESLIKVFSAAHLTTFAY